MWEADSKQESLKFNSHKGNIKTQYEGEKKKYKREDLTWHFFVVVNCNSVLATSVHSGIFGTTVLPEADLHSSIKPWFHVVWLFIVCSWQRGILWSLQMYIAIQFTCIRPLIRQTSEEKAAFVLSTYHLKTTKTLLWLTLTAALASSLNYFCWLLWVWCCCAVLLHWKTFHI